MERRGGESGEADVVNALRVGEQRKVTLLVSGLDPADFGEGFLQGAAVVKGCSVVKAEPVPRFQRHKIDMIREPFPEQREEFLEEKRCRDDSRAGIVPETIALEHLGPPTDFRAAFHQGNPVALRAEAQRRGDAAVSRAQHKGVIPGRVGIRDGHGAPGRVP